MIALPEMDVMVLGALAAKDAPVSIGELAEELGVDQSEVAAACFVRAEAGQVNVEERTERELRLGPRGRAMAERFPERAVIEALEARGLRRVLVEGGGTLLAAFLDAGCIDELRLTICPTLLGGAAAPSLYPGPARKLAERHRLRLLGMGCHGDEVYLRLAPLA